MYPDAEYNSNSEYGAAMRRGGFQTRIVISASRRVFALVFLFFIFTPLEAKEKIMTYTFPEYTYTFRTENGRLWVNDRFIARRSSWSKTAFARDGAIWYIQSNQNTLVSEIRNFKNGISFFGHFY